MNYTTMRNRWLSEQLGVGHADPRLAVRPYRGTGPKRELPHMRQALQEMLKITD